MHRTPVTIIINTQNDRYLVIISRAGKASPLPVLVSLLSPVLVLALTFSSLHVSFGPQFPLVSNEDSTYCPAFFKGDSRCSGARRPPVQFHPLLSFFACR